MDHVDNHLAELYGEFSWLPQAMQAEMADLLRKSVSGSLRWLGLVTNLQVRPTPKQRLQARWGFYSLAR